MSKSSSSSSTSWSVSVDNIFSQEKVVFKTNVGLVVSTAAITALYSYFGIDSNTENAINRSLLMALSTFISASAVNLLENNGYLTAAGTNARMVEGALIPVLYYGITKKQFSIPDMNSQAVKTGVIAAVIGEMSNATVTKYIDQYETTASAASSVGTAPATAKTSTPSVTK